MTETLDSKYFDATAVSVNAEYEECAPLVDLMKSTVRPAYDVRLTVKEAVPASLVTHDVIIDVDVSEVGLRCVTLVVAVTQPHIENYAPSCA